MELGKSRKSHFGISPISKEEKFESRSTGFYWLEAIMIIPSHVEYRLFLKALKPINGTIT
jgi:hypothetical protein